MSSLSVPALAGSFRSSSSVWRDEGAHRRRATEPGGQCMELYPDKPIYYIPAIPARDVQDLVALDEQIEPFV